MKKLILFGAGKIGRSFIGQLFSRSGYEVVFVDVQEQIISELNQRKAYSVVIKSDQPDEILEVKNVRGLLASDEKTIIDELTDCDLAAVSVGQKGLASIIPLLAKAIKARYFGREKMPLDVIIAENMRNADQYIYNGLLNILDNDFPLNEMAGLIETSIGKMVPIMPEAVTQKDPLLVYAEPYNTLILDKKAFKNPIPEIKGLAPKDNIKAWVDRKSYIHNFGHAAVAYVGYLYDPSQKYIYEALSNPAVRSFVIKAMEQSANILMQKYPGVFTRKDMNNHIEDLISRFENRALKDTLYRVGNDLQRKLSVNDRIISPMFDGLRFGLPVDYLMMVFVFGLCFEAKDENGMKTEKDIEFINFMGNNGLVSTLKNLLEINPIEIMDELTSVSISSERKIDPYSI